MAYNQTMNPTLRSGLLWIQATLAAILVLPPQAAAGEGEKVQCCFANPRFSGLCVVVPGPDETCTSILAYLNDPRSAGKTYCGNTDIRGGWRRVACPAEATPAVAPSRGALATGGADDSSTGSDATPALRGEAGGACPSARDIRRPGE